MHEGRIWPFCFEMLAVFCTAYLSICAFKITFYLKETVGSNGYPDRFHRLLALNTFKWENVGIKSFWYFFPWNFSLLLSFGAVWWGRLVLGSFEMSARNYLQRKTALKGNDLPSKEFIPPALAWYFFPIIVTFLLLLLLLLAEVKPALVVS